MSGSPNPYARNGDAKRIAARQRMDRFTALRDAGVTWQEAAAQVGIRPGTGKDYEHGYQLRKRLPASVPPAGGRARCFSWDCRQQPGMEAIAAFVAELSNGKVTMREVDTQSDEYAWIVADHEVSDEQAMKLYRG